MGVLVQSVVWVVMVSVVINLTLYRYKIVSALHAIDLRRSGLNQSRTDYHGRASEARTKAFCSFMSVISDVSRPEFTECE